MTVLITLMFKGYALDVQIEEMIVNLSYPLCALSVESNKDRSAYLQRPSKTPSTYMFRCGAYRPWIQPQDPSLNLPQVLLRNPSLQKMT